MGFFLKNVKCENTTAALGIGTDRPEFAWQLEADEEGAFQGAYRIAVFDGDGALLADTGKVASSQQYGVKVDLHSKVKPFRKYVYELTVWNQKDEPTAPHRGSFLTGIFKPSQWPGEWFRIGFGAVGYARKEFELADEPIREAYCYIGAVGTKANSVTVYINGQQVGQEPIFPGPTEYFRAFYKVNEVTDLLLPGQNTVGLLVSKCASVFIKVFYESGREQDIVSRKAEWKFNGHGGYTLGYASNVVHYGRLEIFDRTGHFEGFAENGFDDGAWDCFHDPYDVIDFAPLLISPQYCTTTMDPPVHPRSITRYDDRILVDFGKNMAGFATFVFTGEKGQTVKMCYSERVLENGYAELSPYHTRCEYTLAGTGREYYRPLFITTGFRVVEIYGYQGELRCEDIKAYFVHSDVETQTKFSSSHTSLNKLSATAKRSFLSNLVNFPTDCPERERRGWTADAYAVCEAECVEFDLVNLYRQWFISYRDCQRQNGWLPVELPMSTDDNIDLNWPVAVIFIPYEVLWQYGDLELCRENYASMQAYADLMLELADEDYYLSPRFYSYKDWQPQAGATAGYLGMAYFYRAIACLSEIAKAIGMDADSTRYQRIAEEIKESINARYYRDGSYDNGTQSANAHALHFGFCPEQNRAAVTASLVANIEREGRNTTGFMGTFCILQALSENGRSDVAYAMLTNPKKGFWLWLIDTYGATTFPEAYDGNCDSQNHAFLGSAPSLWCYKYLSGIRPLEYGYRKIGISPYLPPEINAIDTTVSTPYGEVKVKLMRNESLTATVTVPVGTTAVFTYGGQHMELVSGEHHLMLGN